MEEAKKVRFEILTRLMCIPVDKETNTIKTEHLFDVMERIKGDLTEEDLKSLAENVSKIVKEETKKD